MPRCAKSVLRLLPAYSSPLASSQTENPMEVGLLATPKVIEQLDQIGVITVVVDDKSGIHGEAPRPDLHVVGRGMTANAVPGFKYLNAMAPLGQLVGAPQPGDARSYDCNVHR